MRSIFVSLTLSLVAGFGISSASAKSCLEETPLPKDVRIEAPASDVKPGSANEFVGAWGDGKWGDSLCHTLVVESVDAEGRARVVYSYGETVDITPGYYRETGRIKGKKLLFSIGSYNTDVAYILAEEDGKKVLKGTYYGYSRQSVVTLKKIQLPGK